MMGTVPEWLEPYVRCWVDRLFLQAWRIRLRVQRVIKNDGRVEGLTTQYTDYLTAHIDFIDEIADNPDWRHKVIHEMLHIAHAGVDKVVEEVIITELPEGKQGMAQSAYQRPYEQFVTLMAMVLYQLAEPIDYPKEYRKKK